MGKNQSIESYLKKNRLFVLLGVICLFMIAWKFFNNNIVDKEAEKISWGISKEQFNCSFKFPKDDEVLEIADGLLNGKLTVLDSLEKQSYDLYSLDWNMTFSDSANTYQLYLQSLNSTIYLTRAYELKKETKYLDFAKEFIKEWDKYRKSNLAKSNTFVWYDHGTALRADNIIYFALTAEEVDDFFTDKERGWVSSLIRLHAEFLADNDNYTENHNHGIFQDQALIYCAYFLDSKDKKQWVNISKKRLKTQEEYAFTEEMVHVENSPGYQTGVMELFRLVAEFLRQFDDDFADMLDDDLKEAAEFLAYIIKPNGIIAEIGDTNSLVGTENSVQAGLQVFDNKDLTYAAFVGKKGERPAETSKIFPKSGYYVSHNSWKEENYCQSTWMMFKSGYSSKTHKHADDNSFMLYSKGSDIFVDTGWYNYVTGNRYRDYFVSSHGHNTVIVDDKSYSTTNENSTKVGIYDYKQNENYDYVLGYNEMYSGVSFDRHFYNLGDAIIIYDNMESDEIHKYSQILHASEEMKVVKKSENETLFALNVDNSEKKYYVRVKQLLCNGKNTVVHGDYEDAEFGYISKEMNQLDDIDTLKYDIKGKNSDIITLITIEDEDGKIDGISNIKFDKKNKKFSVKKSSGDIYQIELKSRERLEADDVVMEKQEDDTFKFRHQNVKEEATYAWYVIDKETGEVVDKTEYSKSAEYEYTFDEKDYLIKAYVKSVNGNYRQSSMVAEIKYDQSSGRWYEDKADKEILNLVYIGQEKEEKGKGKYIFKVNLKYFWNYTIKWYIYKDGAYYTSLTVENSNELEYEFTEAGKYCVMYYLATPNGDNVFYNFEEITIE